MRPATIDVQQKPKESYDIRRARHALQQVERLGTIDNETVGIAKKLPMMIRTCGLAQAIAFYDSKKETHLKISNSCGDWLRTAGVLPAQANQRLCAQLVGDQSSPQQLRRCTSEVMAYLFWFIRFLDARKS